MVNCEFQMYYKRKIWKSVMECWYLYLPKKVAFDISNALIMGFICINIWCLWIIFSYAISCYINPYRYNNFLIKYIDQLVPESPALIIVDHNQRVAINFKDSNIVVI